MEEAQRVQRWMDAVAPATAEPSAAAQAVWSSKAWDRLALGELGEAAFDAAAAVGRRGWPWMEGAEAGADARRMALRAVFMADMQELARWAPRLEAGQGRRALAAAGADPRVEDVAWWGIFELTWPMGLALESLPARRCPEWAAVARLAATCDAGNAARAAKLFAPALGAREALGDGRCLAAAWVRAGCEAGAAVEQAARALAQQIGAEPQAEWASLARLELARGAGIFGRAQEDPRTACSSSSYWNAWRLLGASGGSGTWEAWARGYEECVRGQSVAGRRMASCAPLWEALETHVAEDSRWGCSGGEERFGLLVELAKLHAQAWAPTPGEAPSVPCSYYRRKLEEALIGWAERLGQPAQGWARRARELASWSPELGARFERGAIQKETRHAATPADIAPGSAQGAGALRL